MQCCVYQAGKTLHTEAVTQTCSLKKGVLRNFVKFTGKYLCQSLFFNKVTGLRPTTLFKRRLWHRCFSVNFVKFLRTGFLQNIYGRLLLHRKIVHSMLLKYIWNNIAQENSCAILALSMQQWFWRKIIYTSLFWSAWANIAQSNNLYITETTTRGVL